MNNRWDFWTLICFLFLFLLLIADSDSAAQISGSLKTEETKLTFEAGPHAPKLSSLQNGTEVWNNTQSETLISTAEAAGTPCPIEWNLDVTASHSDEHGVSFVYISKSPSLRLTWEWKVRSKHGAIEHEIRIENRDSREIWIPLQTSFRFNWQMPATVPIEQFYIEKGADTPSANGTHRLPVPEKYTWHGASSTYAQPRPGEAREIIPYMLVERSQGAQSGWYVGVEFSGRILLTLARNGASLSGDAGLNPDSGKFRTRLKAGDTFETPQIFLGATSGGPDATANVVRRWVREVLTRQATWNDARYPLTVNNSWGGGMVVDEEIADRMIRDSSALGLEMFHLDAGWFKAVGDWQPDRKKFPHGLPFIADRAHAQGLKFGLWVDWSQAGLDHDSGALSARDPQTQSWLTTDLPSDWKPEPFKGITVDIGDPPAAEWAMRETDRIVSDYKLDMLEHDGYLVAGGCDATDHPHAPPDPSDRCVYRDAGFLFVKSANSTDVSYHAVRAYYEIQENLRKKHPNLLLEICNDGGRMVDFGSAAHGDYFSITDTYDPLSNRRAFYDASFVLPPAMLETYVETWKPGPPVTDIDHFRHMLRSGMMGWLSIMIDTTSWNAEQHEIAKQEIQFYKSRLRPLIRDADLFHISLRPDGNGWDGMEYFDPTSRHGAVFAFRGATQTESNHKFILRGLNHTSRYQVTFHDHSSRDRIMNGSELLKSGLLVKLARANSSEIVLLVEMPLN